MTEENTKDAQVYELGYHVPSTLSDSDREKVLEGVRAQITKAGGNFVTEGTPEDTRLAYTIEDDAHNKHIATFFGWMKFEMDPAAIPALTETLGNEEGIVRFRIVKTVKEDTRAATAERTHTVVQEVETKGVLEKKVTKEESTGEVSEADLDKSLDDLTGEGEEKKADETK